MVPEIDRFDSEREVHDILQQATLRFRSFVAITLMALAIVALVLLSRTVLASWFGLSAGLTQGIVQPIGMVVAFYWLFNHGLRRPFQRALRQAILDRGEPICMQCGYDLRGQTQPPCPECGTAFDADILADRSATSDGT